MFFMLLTLAATEICYYSIFILITHLPSLIFQHSSVITHLPTLIFHHSSSSLIFQHLSSSTHLPSLIVQHSSSSTHHHHSSSIIHLSSFIFHHSSSSFITHLPSLTHFSILYLDYIYLFISINVPSQDTYRSSVWITPGSDQNRRRTHICMNGNTSYLQAFLDMDKDTQTLAKKAGLLAKQLLVRLIHLS